MESGDRWDIMEKEFTMIIECCQNGEDRIEFTDYGVPRRLVGVLICGGETRGEFKDGKSSLFGLGCLVGEVGLGGSIEAELGWSQVEEKRDGPEWKRGGMNSSRVANSRAEWMMSRGWVVIMD